MIIPTMIHVEISSCNKQGLNDKMNRFTQTHSRLAITIVNRRKVENIFLEKVIDTLLFC